MPSLQIRAARFLLSTLVWCVGLLQACLFGMVCIAERYTFSLFGGFGDKFKLKISVPGSVVGPCCLSLGAAVTAITYMRLLETADGVAYMMELAGKSTWLDTVRTTAESWGALGLFFLQVAPVPIPTAVIVTAGKLARVPEVPIFVVVIGSKLVQLLFSAQLMVFQLKGTGLLARVLPEDILKELQGFSLSGGGSSSSSKSKEGKSKNSKKKDSSIKSKEEDKDSEEKKKESGKDDKSDSEEESNSSADSEDAEKKDDTTSEDSKAPPLTVEAFLRKKFVDAGLNMDELDGLVDESPSAAKSTKSPKSKPKFKTTGKKNQ